MPGRHNRAVSQRKTPKALANFSPALERRDNPGLVIQFRFQPCKGSLRYNPFRVNKALFI